MAILYQSDEKRKIFIIIYKTLKVLILQRIIQNKKILLFLITLQEAFIAIIPFFILTGILTLLNILIQYFHIKFFFISPEHFSLFTKTIQSYTSIIPTISIAYFFAKRIKISEIMAILLSVTTFITIIFYEHPAFPLELPYGFTAATVTNPIIATIFLKYLYPVFSLDIKANDGKHYAYRLFNYLFVFFIAYFATMITYITIDFVMDYLIDELNPFNLDLPGIVLLVIRNLLVQIFWFFGMHGEHMVNALFGKELLFKEMFPNLTYGEFQRIFVNIGGAGIGLAILISLLITAKDKTIKKIAFISSPFTIFNIDNILIFLVIVFNRFLLIPFILLPIMNVLIAYISIKIFNIQFTNYYVVWSMPVFFDAYLKSHCITAMILQMFLLALDVFIYTHFMKKFFSSQSILTHASALEHNLEIETELRAKEDIKAFQANQELIDANFKIREVIDNLNTKKLFIYYQPKVDIKNNKVEKFEALIRYNDDGKIKGPYFLDIIEKAGLAPIIDIWVCKQVKKDIEKFRKLGFYPILSVNLHPDTLKSTDAISKILDILKDENIIFEIIERSFVNKTAVRNINRLKSSGFGLSIDDYGVGYSSLETLIKYKIDELKLDKTLIDKIESHRGYLICSHTIHLCKEIGIEVVAEGVETQKQLEILKNLGVDLIQGYIFAPALPLNKAVKFAKEFEKLHLKLSRA